MNAPPLSRELASPGDRLSARSIDVMLIVFLVAPVALWIGSLASSLDRLVVVAPGLYFLAGNLYGATPGKRALGIFVRRGDDRSPGFRFGLLRSVDVILLVLVSMMSPSAASILSIGVVFGYMLLLWDENCQTLYDRIAGTYVVASERQQRGSLVSFVLAAERFLLLFLIALGVAFFVALFAWSAFS